ncbi:MAG: hypothetical protein JXP34_27260, partial [Planctomycetes bacterium]|nr:hypothetical protein [Planctomycetota bacterium]
MVSGTRGRISGRAALAAGLAAALVLCGCERYVRAAEELSDAYLLDGSTGRTLCARMMLKSPRINCLAAREGPFPPISASLG